MGQNGKGGRMLPRSMKGLRFYLARLCFMDTGRRHETPVSEKVSLLLMAIAVTRVSATFLQSPKPQIPQGSTQRVRCQLHVQWVVLQERNPKLKESKSFIMGSRHAYLLLQRETLSPSSTAIQYTNILVKTVQNKCNGCPSCKVCRNGREP